MACGAIALASAGKMKSGLEEAYEPFYGEIEAISGAFDRGDHLSVVALEDVHSLDADEKIAHLEARIICRRTSYHRTNLKEEEISISLLWISREFLIYSRQMFLK